PLARDVVRAREWADEQQQAGGTGDRDRLEPGVSDRAWAQVSVSARECLGAHRCRFGTECFAEQARARAMEADIVVTNHALLAIDALEGLSVLPEHGVVVVDEGHELVARVTSAATAELWPGVVERAGRRVRPYVDDGDASELEDAAEPVRRALLEAPVGRLDTPLPESLTAAVMGVRDASRAVQSAFAAAAKDDRDPDAEAGRRTAKALVDEMFATASRIAAGSEQDVAWVEERERGGRVLKVAPLSVAGLLRDRLFGESTVIVTSATLELGGSFDPVARSFGVVGENGPRWRGLKVGSPFDYARQSIMYVAQNLPPPGRDGLRPEAVDALADLVAAAGGRTLGLFSSRRAATEAAEALRPRLADVPILCQGDDVVPTLVRRFAEDER